MLTAQRLEARYSHWLVYPPEAAAHRGLQAFRTWLHEEAAEHVRHTEREVPADIALAGAASAASSSAGSKPRDRSRPCQSRTPHTAAPGCASGHHCPPPP